MDGDREGWRGGRDRNIVIDRMRGGRRDGRREGGKGKMRN